MPADFATFESDLAAGLQAVFEDADPAADAESKAQDLAAVIREKLEALVGTMSVAFTAGKITGTDSNGDTHSTLTATGGVVS